MEELAQHARDLFNIQLTAKQQDDLKVYEIELLRWNESVNLTAIKSPEQVRTKHYLDSLSCMCVMRDSELNRVIDIGTGAGFPGLPLKIINPSMALTLVESVGKKADFCRHIVKLLALEEVTIMQTRAERVGQSPEHRGQYDWAISRAVAKLPILAEYMLPMVQIGGTMLAMKGESAHAEAQSAEYAINVLGGHLRQVVPVILPGVAEERYLVVIDKVAATPMKYPRRVGIPGKRPLKSAG